MQKELEFTGNWFIDLGILGFVNLMEEVYGKEYRQSKELFYYAFFAYYIKKTATGWIKRQGLKTRDKNKKEQFSEITAALVTKIKRAVSETTHEVLSSGEELKREEVREKVLKLNKVVKSLIEKQLSKFKMDLRKVFSNNKKDIIDKIKETGIIISEGFFQNLNFMNPSKNKSGKERSILESFEKMVYEYYIKKDLTKDAIDKTLSKFLFSEKEFPNIIMGKIPTIGNLKNLKIMAIDPLLVLLSFPIPFVQVQSVGYIAFYTPSLEATYFINKKLRTFMEKIDNNSKKENVLKLTWQGIIDYLTEEKALFSLENMYLIEYENIVNQELKGVEYIGIQKLQAELILDDGLRNSLNTWLEIIQQQENKFIKVWLLEEFIKGKPLLPLFYKNMQLYLSGKLNRFNTSRLIYSAAIDKVVSSINSDNRKPVFSDDFFEKHKKTLELVKSHSREYFKIKNTIWNLFSSLSDKDRLSFAYRLFTRLKKNQKYSFVNELLKELNNVKGEVKPIIEHIFKNLLPNDKTWQSEAIPIIAGLIKGG